jgi:hypothetical protein
MIITGLTLTSPHGIKRLKEKQVATTIARIFFFTFFGTISHDR